MEETTENCETTLKANSNDLAAQREARRMKILLNSNNRLEKITGKACDEEQDGKFSIFRAWIL